LSALASSAPFEPANVEQAFEILALMQGDPVTPVATAADLALASLASVKVPGEVVAPTDPRVQRLRELFDRRDGITLKTSTQAHCELVGWRGGLPIFIEEAEGASSGTAVQSLNRQRAASWGFRNLASVEGYTFADIQQAVTSAETLARNISVEGQE